MYFSYKLFGLIETGLFLEKENQHISNFFDKIDYQHSEYKVLFEQNKIVILNALKNLFGDDSLVSNLSLEIFVYNSAPIFIIDPDDGKILLANIESSIFYNYSLDELHRMSIYDLIASNDFDINQEINKSVKYNRNFVKVEHITQHKGIRIVDVYSTSFMIGSKKFFLTIIIDRTDDETFEKELMKNNTELTKVNSNLSEKILGYQSNNNRLVESARYMTDLMSKKDRLFSILSHDIKNYIHTILNISNGLITDSVIENYDPYLMNQLNNLHISTDYLHKLLVNLLDWSKVQTGKMNIVINDYLLKDIIESNFQLFRIQAESKKINFINNIDEDLVVKTDINIINTILRNLISNSIKFSNIKKSIKLSSENLTHNSVVINLEDEGIGISDDIKKKIFNIRHQVNSLGTMGESGSGIGLLLIKELIDGLGERIWFESELGIGTKFHFTIRKI